MIRKRIWAVTALTALVILCGYSMGWGYEITPYPRLANVYLAMNVENREVDILSNWDLLVLYYKLDADPALRDRIKDIENKNPNIMLLMYISSMETNVTEEPPSPMEEACDAYDWWLRDYEGNYLYNPNFPWSMLINMTNTAAASGSHPEGKKANEFLAETVMEEHLTPYAYWDGLFYDTFTDNLAWMFRDIKDANRNGIPEYDQEENDGEPMFSDLWADGARTLAQNTISLKPDVIIIGNGLHKGTLDELNGRFLESFTLSPTKNMHLLCSNHKYLSEGSRTPRVSIVNGHIRDTDPTRYQDLRFSLCATLMTDNYYSGDFGSRYHAETLWYDEYSLREDGTVDGVTTALSAGIDAEQTDIAVVSTEGFRENGTIEIDGEQIYYESKSQNHFLDCYRGFPRRNKYDLRAPHTGGTQVIQHYAEHTGYLGQPLGKAFDAGNMTVILDDLLEKAGWFADDEEAQQINSRVWRRNFEHGAVLVNPTENSEAVYGLGDKVYRKISGLQDPVHNDGGILHDSLRVAPGDGYILVWISETDTIPPAPPEGLHVRP